MMKLQEVPKNSPISANDCLFRFCLSFGLSSIGLGAGEAASSLTSSGSMFELPGSMTTCDGIDIIIGLICSRGCFASSEALPVPVGVFGCASCWRRLWRLILLRCGLIITQSLDLKILRRSHEALVVLAQDVCFAL